MSGAQSPSDRKLPLRYGEQDTLGAANEIDEAKVAEAASLIREGRRYPLAQVLDDASPAPMWRYWKHALVVDQAMSERATGTNRQTSVEESVAGALHSGTHLDGLGHVGIGEHAYGGRRYPEIVGPTGLRELGIEHVPPLFTRGVLLDIAQLEEVEVLDEGFVITDAHLTDAAARQGVEPAAGDIVLVHTGWGELWRSDPSRYIRAEPGIGLSAANWCTQRRVAVIGADNWAVEVLPSEESGLSFPVHQHCITRFGCYLLENVVTAELVRDQVYEFCCVILPLRLRGASASLVSPVALV